MAPRGQQTLTPLCFLLVTLVSRGYALQWGGSGQPWVAQDGDVTTLLRYDVTLNEGEVIGWLAWYKIKEGAPTLVAGSSGGKISPALGYEERVSLGGSHGNLLLYNVSLEDAGLYKCVVGIPGKEDQGPAAETRLLQVRGAPEQPMLRQVGDAVENDIPLTLTCNTSSTSLPSDPAVTFTYSWFVNDTLLQGHAGDTLTLNVTRWDSGMYSCSARENSQRGMTSSPSDVIYVDVLYLPEVALRQADPELPFEVTAGQPMTLTCDVITANPPVPADGYSWSYLPSTSGLEVQQLSARGSSLTVGHVTRADGGRYTCWAKNRAGSSAASLSIRVLYTPVVHIEPRATTLPARLHVLEGDFLTLTCNVTEADPPVQWDGYSWSYLPSPDRGGEVVALPGNGSKVTVGPMTRRQGGRYLCSARNDFKTHSTIPPGTARQTVDVLFSPEVRIEPRGSQHLPYRAISGVPLNLTCHVQAANPPVPINGYSWSYLPSPSGPEARLHGAGAVLSLGHVTRSSSGHYRCQASNDAEVDIAVLPGSDTARLDVMYVENVNISDDVEAETGDVVILTCNVESHPFARMTWSVDGRPLRHVTSNSDSYVITEATCSDNGEYACDVSNDEIPGKTLTATTTVRVHCPPQEDGSLVNESIVLATPGETVRLSLAVVAFPPPTFKWYSPTLAGPIKYGIESNHSFSAVTLGKVKVADSGTYTVNVTNIHGSLTRHFLVLVDEPARSSGLNHSGSPSPCHCRRLDVLLIIPLIGWALTVIAFAVYVRSRLGGFKLSKKATRKGKSQGFEVYTNNDCETPRLAHRDNKVLLHTADDKSSSGKDSSESDYRSGESQSFV